MKQKDNDYRDKFNKSKEFFIRILGEKEFNEKYLLYYNDAEKHKFKGWEFYDYLIRRFVAFLTKREHDEKQEVKPKDKTKEKLYEKIKNIDKETKKRIKIDIGSFSISKDTSNDLLLSIAESQIKLVGEISKIRVLLEKK